MEIRFKFEMRKGSFKRITETLCPSVPISHLAAVAILHNHSIQHLWEIDERNCYALLVFYVILSVLHFRIVTDD